MCVLGQKRPPLPSRDSSEQQKKERKGGGGKGKREWKEGVLFAQLHPDHPAPSVLVTVGRGSKGLAAGPCLYPSHGSRVPHTVRTWTNPFA